MHPMIRHLHIKVVCFVRSLRIFAVSFIFGRLPPFAYAAAYLALIPLYAAIYVYAGDHFFHSTSTLEPAYFQAIEDLEEGLLLEVQSQIDESEVWLPIRTDAAATAFREEPGEISADEEQTAWVLATGGSPNFRAPNQFSIDGDVVVLHVYSAIIEKERAENGFIFHLKSTIPLNWLRPDADAYPKTVWLSFLPANPLTGNAVTDENSVGYLHSNGIMYDQPREPIRLAVGLSEETLQIAWSILNANQGRPSGLPNGIARMLYFSAVTVTTLGYGDIVPLTNFSRLLVASQSILGIILIGFFLSSVTARWRQP